MIHTLIRASLDLVPLDTDVGQLMIFEPFHIPHGFRVNPAAKVLNLCICVFCKQAVKRYASGVTALPA
jgi:hypothetical protein